MAIELKKSRALAALNLTPLIDMGFLPLIFFLVATKFAEEDARSIPVKLPEAAEARPIAAKLKDIYVNIDASGRYFMSGRQLSPQALLSELERARAANPGRQQTVIIRG